MIGPSVRARHFPNPGLYLDSTIRLTYNRILCDAVPAFNPFQLGHMHPC